MIQTLTIQNYQSHKKTILEFSLGLNVIVGPSDSGKTTILRTLRWIKDNRPGGDAFRSTWGGDTRVEILLDDENVIARGKGDDNYYDLNDQHFVAFKTDIPEEISKVLNLNEINLQAQFDQPFLLTSTAGEVAVHFNKLAHIEKIDIATKRIKSWITSLEHDIASDENTLVKYNQELSKYKDLEKLETDLEVLEDMSKQVTRQLSNITKLNTLIEDIEDVEEAISEYSYLLEMESSIDALLLKYSTISETEVIITNISTICESISKIKTRIKKELDLIQLSPEIESLLEVYAEKESIEKEQSKLSALLESISTAEININLLNIHTIELQAAFTEEMGDTCPLCDQSIPHTH